MLLLLVGLFATPYDPMGQDFLESRLAPSSWAHPMGVDGLGRDVASRVWAGGAHTLVMGISATLGALAASLLLLAAEQNGPIVVGRAIRQTIGVWIAIPVLFVGLLLLVFLRPSPETLVLAVAVGGVPLAFRQLRILWLEQRKSEYVMASLVLGAGRWRLLLHTVWPNLRPDAWAVVKLIFALSVLELSGLAFLGLIGDPDFPELGALLRENQRYLFLRPGLVIWPGVVLTGLLVAVQLSGLGRGTAARGRGV
jgi:peptide/nickel transport system permease protein